jgi:Protein of unknown function (DUF2786)
VLSRIRKLLAVAEHPNTPPEEADAAARAAERLIAKHAVDEALLDAKQPTGSRPEARSIEVDPPYARAKTGLVGAVANAHGVQAITTDRPGETLVVTLIGFPADLQVVELLYTSLLLQATTSVLRQPESGRGFRRAFLLGFAAEVGERLRAARQAAVTETAGGGAALVLRDRQADVDAAVRERFPRLRTTRTTVSDGRGLVAGRRSGANASLATSDHELGNRQGALDR